MLPTHLKINYILFSVSSESRPKNGVKYDITLIEKTIEIMS
ncbi:hypothetical protein NIES4106_40510 [Fischerella sp. NIES-4106]|jgi:hypothetical protein|nr:hypothetical protein NIES4106_40510 [Fischerella sp. NIES-4106]